MRCPIGWSTCNKAHTLDISREAHTLLGLLTVSRYGKPPYELTVGDWQGFLNALFDNWNSRFDPPPNPKLPADLKKNTFIAMWVRSIGIILLQLQGNDLAILK